MNPLHGLAIVLVALGAMIGVVKILGARGVVGAEASRKLVHIGMGCVCLSFPWLFTEIWPVWLLAIAACLALGALRVVAPLKRRFGGVLHGVDRASASWGELYFPLGVALVFTLAHPRALPFVIPVAVLTFADAAGALVGKQVGRRRYTTLEGTKTAEGSFAVGAVGFLCAFVPLALVEYRLSSALLIGALIGLFCLLVEAISWRGLDNVFLPLAAYAQMSIYLTLDDAALLGRLVALVAIAVVALIWRRGHLVDDSARLGAALALYFFWAVGDWPWLVAPLVLLASYVRLMPEIPGRAPVHNLVAIICVTIAGLVWCVAHAVARDGPWLWPFALSMATQQAVIATVRFSQARPQWSRAAWCAAGVAQAVALQGLAFWLVDRGATIGVAEYAWGALAVAAATAGFALWERRLQMPDDLTLRWWKQGTTAVVASAAGVFSLYA
jgi:phytol kinase